MVITWAIKARGACNEHGSENPSVCTAPFKSLRSLSLASIPVGSFVRCQLIGILGLSSSMKWCVVKDAGVACLNDT